MSRTARETPPSEGGLLLVDKAGERTSHDVVARARRALDTRRIGHTGTLDPFATGLLLLCVGPATRLTEYFHRLRKRYDATLRLGVETRTHDLEGDVRARSEAWRGLGREAVEAALAGRVGAQEQRPPSFSAKRVEGRRAHRLARGGEAPSLAPVPVRIHRLELVAFEPPELTLRADVSTGTYVRALARDLGRDLGCGAHLTALRRTAIGPFRVEDALEESVLEQAGWGDRRVRASWRSPAEAVAWLPVRELNEEEDRRVRHGAAVADPTAGSASAAGEPPPVALLREGRLVAVAERRDGALQPRKVFAAP